MKNHTPKNVNHKLRENLKTHPVLARIGWLILAGFLLAPYPAPAKADRVHMTLEVDAREITRQLVHVKEELPVQPGPLALWYPKWVPGTHGPLGPVQNIGGLYLETADGRTIAWRRDETEVYRIECTVPEDVESLVIRIDYICGRADDFSVLQDCFCNGQLGLVNWSCCLLYPESVSIDDMQVSARLLFPEQWRFATALRTRSTGAGVVEFADESLRLLVDNPVIFGEHLRTYDLKPANFPPVFLHLVSESSQAIQLQEKVVKQYCNVASQAGVMFGGAHFDEYHWLVILDDQIGYTGIEHHRCSLNGAGERDLVDEEKLEKGWAAELLPHEFVHSWCGKHRRPAGMVTSNFHKPEQVGMLWIYEGLTMYLGELLMVRSGLMNADTYLAYLTIMIDTLSKTTGRQWRSLEDTAISNYILADNSNSWRELRRGWDYYREGMLIWMEADAIIREKTDGRCSLEDFCRKFMGPQRRELIVPYAREEIVRTLNEIVEYDWESFLHERVDVPQEALALTVVERLGYRLQYSAKPSEHWSGIERDRGMIWVQNSIGLRVSGDGTIEVLPETPADKAGLAPGMKIEAVNGKRFSRDRLLDAIAESPTSHQIELLISEGDFFRTFVIPYAGGPRYLELERDPDRPDLLAEILKPL